MAGVTRRQRSRTVGIIGLRPLRTPVGAPGRLHNPMCRSTKLRSWRPIHLARKSPTTTTPTPWLTSRLTRTYRWRWSEKMCPKISPKYPSKSIFMNWKSKFETLKSETQFRMGLWCKKIKKNNRGVEILPRTLASNELIDVEDGLLRWRMEASRFWGRKRDCLRKEKQLFLNNIYTFGRIRTR